MSGAVKGIGQSAERIAQRAGAEVRRPAVALRAIARQAEIGFVIAARPGAIVSVKMSGRRIYYKSIK